MNIPESDVWHMLRFFRMLAEHIREDKTKSESLGRQVERIEDFSDGGPLSELLSEMRVTRLCS